MNEAVTAPNRDIISTLIRNVATSATAATMYEKYYIVPNQLKSLRAYRVLNRIAHGGTQHAAHNLLKSNYLQLL